MPRNRPSRKRLAWWRRPVDEIELPGILRSRAGLTLIVFVLIGIISTPWLLVLLLSLLAAGILVAVLIRVLHREESPSIFKTNPPNNG
jgi:hypothetical protein